MEAAVLFHIMLGAKGGYFQKQYDSSTDGAIMNCNKAFPQGKAFCRQGLCPGAQRLDFWGPWEYNFLIHTNTQGAALMNLFFQSDLYDILSKLYSTDRVMQTMEKLKDLERPRRYSAFLYSTAWCVQVLEDAGFSEVRRIAHKADGETASYDFIMPQAWDLLGRSTL
jgi:hypothetical protein